MQPTHQEEPTIMKPSSKSASPVQQAATLLFLVLTSLQASMLVGYLDQWKHTEISFRRFQVESEAPFPQDPQGPHRMADLKQFNPRDEASLFAHGSQQGVAVVRSLSLSVTRQNASTPQQPTTVGHSVRSASPHHQHVPPAIATTAAIASHCTPDALTALHNRLNTLIFATQGVEVVFESTDGVDACTTQSVEKRLAIPTNKLDEFAAAVRQFADGSSSPQHSPMAHKLVDYASLRVADSDGKVNILGDRSEIWELPNVNAADIASEMSIALTTQQRRLLRYRGLYESAVNMTDKSRLLELVLQYERTTLTLERQQQQQLEKHSSPRALVIISIVDRDIRQWAAVREKESLGWEERVYNAKLWVSAQSAIFCILMVALLLATKKLLSTRSTSA